MPTNTLHITNGDGAANPIKASTVAGDVLPWRDPMHHGPFPMQPDLDAISQMRARYLVGPDVDPAGAIRDFRLRDDHLRAYGEYDEVVLWFEHDLLDQLQVLQLLDWFADRQDQMGATRLSMICINKFPGIELFRGLGQLDREQLASLYPQRVSVTTAQMSLAKQAWAAFCSSDPNPLLALTRQDTDALPFLKAALLRSFEEYPWVRDGLTRTERQLLELAGSGVSAPGRLFVANMELEDYLFMGDSPTYRHIEGLANLPPSLRLLECGPDANFVYPPYSQVSREDFRAQRLTLSTLGQDVLEGKRHASEILTRDMWLGGVELKSDRQMWMWDDAATTFVLR